jgi:hypothetical protein
MMFVVTIANAIAALVLGIMTVLKAQASGSRKSLRAGTYYAGLAVGWAVTAFWPEAWNWGLPTWLIVGMVLVERSDK